MATATEDIDVFINAQWKENKALRKRSLFRTISKIATLNSFSEEDRVVGVFTSGGDSSGCNLSLSHVFNEIKAGIFTLFLQVNIG